MAGTRASRSRAGEWLVLGLSNQLKTSTRCLWVADLVLRSGLVGAGPLLACSGALQVEDLLTVRRRHFAGIEVPHDESCDVVSHALPGVVQQGAHLRLVGPRKFGRQGDSVTSRPTTPAGSRGLGHRCAHAGEHTLIGLTSQGSPTQRAGANLRPTPAQTHGFTFRAWNSPIFTG